jgi:hypothetical protein
MGFDVSATDKDRLEPLIADGKWHRLIIAGKSAQPVTPGETDFLVHIYGRQAELKANRMNGTLWLGFVRVPIDDVTALCPYPVSLDDPDFAAVLTTMVDVTDDVTGMGVQYKTRVRNLTLKNRVYKADRR